jgi:hypothetical protein
MYISQHVSTNKDKYDLPFQYHKSYEYITMETYLQKKDPQTLSYII